MKKQKHEHEKQSQNIQNMHNINDDIRPRNKRGKYHNEASSKNNGNENLKVHYGDSISIPRFSS